jgi:DNA-binding SARP family transcriptional activator
VKVTRVYVVGQVAIEAGDVRIEEPELGGRHARLLLAMFVIERQRAIPREELAEAVWGSALTASWEPALRGVVAKVRHLFASAGLDPSSTLTHSLGCYHLRLADSTLVDLELASEAVETAEEALRRSDPNRAWGPALAAATVARRPFLFGEEGAWVDRQRSRLQTLLGRALHALSESRLRRGELELALAAAEEAASLAPYHESAQRQLMQAHAAAGNRAEALLHYNRCRNLLANELGVDPSPQTQSLYLALLKAEP